MNITVNDVIKAVDYAVKSPFVKMIQGVENNEEISIAKEIYESSHLLGTIKKEHENVLSVFSEASKNPELYLNGFAESVEKEQNQLEKMIQEETQKFDAVPKIDKEFVLSCQQEIEKIRAKKETERKEIRKKFEKKFDAEILSWRTNLKNKLIFTILGVVVVFALCYFFKNWLETCFGIAFIFFLILWHFWNDGTCKPERVPEADIQREIDKAVGKCDGEIAEINKKIQLGYDYSSEFYKNLEKAKFESDKTLRSIRDRVSELIAYQEFEKRGFQNGVSVVQKTLDNFESLSNWAANCVRDQMQNKHNEEMAYIEREKLDAQKVANRAQEKAIREQNEILKRQTEVAEQQAKAAQQQAENSEEIRRRMEIERFGDYYESFRDDHSKAYHLRDHDKS